MKADENLPPAQDSDRCQVCGHEWSQHASHGKGGRRGECWVEGCKCSQFISSGLSAIPAVKQ